ncbi:MAG: hypothetical protein LAT68_14800 [Cyclobacteriaceae bacterium]|nr:hypothetical protein [Cyclobacteriaceae bacterium]MCH8517589.1 hypothetical protein [Cyclobacteriaceae bacterium]
MNFNIIKYTLLLLLTAFIFTACGEDEESLVDVDDDRVGKVTIRLHNEFDGEPIQFGKRYTNEAGNEFELNTWRYYVSNFRFRNSQSGDFYAVRNSYHLARATEDETVFEISFEIPEGDFNQVEFGMGVDNRANTSIDRKGDLDPANDMAWNWNVGYKFIRLEGDFFPESGNRRGLVFHTGENANYKIITLPTQDFGPLEVRVDQERIIDIAVEVHEVWKNPNTIDFSVEGYNEVMFGPRSAEVAENFTQGMFTLRDLN